MRRHTISSIILSKITLALGLAILICAASPVFATVYVYVTPDGSKLITDKKVNKQGYSLERSYATKPYGAARSRSPYYAKPIKSQYDALIVNVALKYDLEPSFVKAVIHIESAFDPAAISRAGAMGLMQLMPGTAANYQLKQDHFNPNLNMNAGVQHLKDLMERYNGNKELSLAAYNAGEGAVSKYQGIPPYPETQDYVSKVLKLYKLYKKEI
ncbi:lytic transglycosylase domain-containing protein [Arenicella xantha]|uniref:Transglycosylase-like protein with SLT domain n=1 Tax=Arenicella xantha TaxID=644221 RepID=A0A395JH84_9GAMM|nr:lytic transglycosylase domain-containing protein [Arenicella xantha]RBP49276.1 transglycosylase-like protein with SLT domain [Arenicella xantha]